MARKLIFAVVYWVCYSFCPNIISALILLKPDILAHGVEMIENKEFQKRLIATVREFVKREVIPEASELEHADKYPEH